MCRNATAEPLPARRLQRPVEESTRRVRGYMEEIISTRHAWSSRSVSVGGYTRAIHNRSPVAPFSLFIRKRLKAQMKSPSSPTRSVSSVSQITGREHHCLIGQSPLRAVPAREASGDRGCGSSSWGNEVTIMYNGGSSDRSLLAFDLRSLIQSPFCKL